MEAVAVAGYFALEQWEETLACSLFNKLATFDHNNELSVLKIVFCYIYKQSSIVLVCDFNYFEDFVYRNLTTETNICYFRH